MAEVETGNNIRNIIFRNLTALIIQAETIGLHIIEPDLIGTACASLCKDQNGSRNTSVRFEYTRGH